MERDMMKFVEDGVLSVDGEGRIWRLKKGKWNYNKIRRAEFVDGRYYAVIMKRGTKKLYCQASRLVWQYNYGDIPKDLEINHIDADRFNNNIKNLEVVTHLENIRHAERLGLRTPAKGERQHESKLKNRDVIEIRRLHKTGNYTILKLSEMYNIATSTMGSVIHRKTWRHI